MVVRGRYSPVGTKLEKGTAQGQMIFWDATLQMWVHTEVAELFFDDTNKWLGVRTNSPAAELEVSGTLVITRLLAGGVLP